jgi:transposase
MSALDCPGCQALQRRVAELEQRVEELTRLLDDARRAGKRQAAPFRKGEPKPNPKRPGRKSGEAHGRHGHRPPPAPDQVQEVHEAPLPGACPCCGGAVAEAEVVAQYQTEIPRQPIVRQFNVHVGHCQDCGRRVQGRHPLQTSDALGAAASQLGPDAQAAMAGLNKQAGLSHGKVVATLEALYGIDVTRGASAQVVLRAAERLQPAYQEVLQDVRQSEQLSADETGWRVGGRPAWLHVWVGERSTGYAIDPHRSADALERVIGLDWDGVLIHDGFASYDRFAQAAHQQCVAHILRRARELLEGATRGAVRFPRQVIALFTEAVHLRNEHLRGALPAGELLSARAGFEERLLALVAAERAVPAYETLSAHLWRHFDSWFTFLAGPSVAATNWQAEQAVRPAVVNRKVWGGNRTEAGAAAQGVLTSVLETCRRQGRSALDFVSAALRAFGNRLLPQPALLTTR